MQPSPHTIRTFGDPVLKSHCAEITDIDATIVKLATDMIRTMAAARGVGLAGPQVGVMKQIFVYDEGKGPRTVINPKITNETGEWQYDEGCLSVPGLYFSIVRPASVLLTGIDLDGNALEIEANELLGRIFQHEVDHLNGKLLLSRLDKEQRRDALRTLRERDINA